MVGSLFPILAVSTAIAFVCAVILMFALRPAAHALGLVDRPGGRKMHDGEIPLIGGLAIAGSLCAVVLLGAPSVTGLGYFLFGIATLVAVGTIDDRFDLGPGVRFVAQIGVTLLMIFGAGIVVTDLGRFFAGQHFQLGVLAAPFTILLVLTAVNAFNLFDGSDGVAGGQAIVALGFLGTAAFAAGSHTLLPVIAALGGAILGFLVFNWPSKRRRGLRAFMGDAGSTTVGFALAWLSIELSQGPGRALSPAMVLWIFALPIYDLFSCMIRRVTHGRSPLSADADHFHHVLKRWGLSSRRVAQVVLVTAAALSCCGIVGFCAGLNSGQLFAAWLIVGAMYHVIFGTKLIDRWRQSLLSLPTPAEVPLGMVRAANEDSVEAQPVLSTAAESLCRSL